MQENYPSFTKMIFLDFFLVLFRVKKPLYTFQTIIRTISEEIIDHNCMIAAFFAEFCVCV